MGLTLRASASAFASSASPTITIPASTQGGDGLYIVTAGGWNPSATPPAGWTLVQQQLGLFWNSAVYSKMAAGTPGSVSTEAGNVVTLTYTGGAFDVQTTIYAVAGGYVVPTINYIESNACTAGTINVTAAANDLMLYYGSGRPNSALTLTLSSGTTDATRSADTNTGSVIGHQNPAAGALSQTFTPSAAGAGNTGRAYFVLQLNSKFDDTFANAGVITPPSFSIANVDTTGWSTEGSEPGSMSHTGWASFTPTQTTSYRLSTVGSNFDTLLAIYTGTALNNLVLVGSDDNSGGSGTSLLDIVLTAGTTYYIQVGAQPAGSGGLLKFSVSGTPINTNDYTAAILADSPSGFWLFDALDGTDASGNLHTATINAAASYSSGSGINASPAGRLACTSTTTTDVTMPVAVSGTAWTYEFWIRTTANSGGILGSRIVGADPGIEVALGNNGTIGNSGQITVGFNTNSVYRGVTSNAVVNDGDWHHVVCVWSGTAGAAIASAQFTIYIDGANSTGGSGGVGTAPNAPITGDVAGWSIGSRHFMSSSILMDLDGVACYNAALSSARITAHYNQGRNPFADTFANAGAFTSSYVVSGIDTTAWTTEGGEPGSMAHTGWATFTPSITTTYRLSSVGSNYDTKLAVYTGTVLASLVLVASDDNSGAGNTSIINTVLTAGTTYYVQIGAQPAGAGGTLQFAITSTPDAITNYSVAVLADSPLAYYPIDTNLSDYSGNLHTLSTDANSSLAAGSGARGSAGRLSLTSTVASPTTDVKPSGLTAFSYECWVKTTATSGALGGFGQIVSSDLQFILYLGNFASLVGSNGQAVFVITKGSFAVGVASSVTINDGNWHHVVGTWAGTSGVAYASSQFKIYVDGLDVTSGTTNFNPGPTAPFSPTRSWIVGAFGGSGGTVTEIDDVALYATALPAARVAAHISSGYFEDNFANAPVLANLLTLSNIDTTGWTTEVSEPGSMSHTGWTKYTPASTGLYRINTIGSNFDTLLALYTGTALNNLVQVVADDNSGGSGTSLIQNFSLTAGTTYYIQVGAQPAGGGGTLSFMFAAESSDRLAAISVELVSDGAGAGGGIPDKRLAGVSAEVVTNAAGQGSGIPDRRLAAVNIEVLTPTKYNFIGWGLPQ